MTFWCVSARQVPTSTSDRAPRTVRTNKCLRSARRIARFGHPEKSSSRAAKETAGKRNFLPFVFPCPARSRGATGAQPCPCVLGDIVTHGHRVSVPSSHPKRRGWGQGTSLRVISRAHPLLSSHPWLTKTSTHLPQADFSTEQLDEKALRTLATVRRSVDVRMECHTTHRV